MNQAPEVRKVASCRGFSMRNLHATSEVEPEAYFCKYLMEPPNEGTLEIVVKDSGCGISQEDQEKLFKPFSQANKGIHSRFGGTGLGLWLSHKLIGAMKGTLTCNSELGAGTAFIIRVPAKCKDGKSAIYVNIYGVHFPIIE